MHLSGCDSVTTALMREKRSHLCVQVEPSAKAGFVSVLRDMVDPTATGPFVHRIVELQKEEGLVMW